MAKRTAGTFGTEPCKWCGKQVDVRGRKQHEQFCEARPDPGASRPSAVSAEPISSTIVDEEAPLDEMENLMRVIREAWPTNKAHSVIRAFSHGNPSDLGHLDELLTIAGANPSARRLIITNWALHRGIPMPAEMEDMYARGESPVTRPKSRTARDYIDELRKERAETIDELRLKKEELRLKQEIEALADGENPTDKTKLVELPLTDPKSGRPVFDAEGNVVMVKVDPQREFNYFKLMEMRGAAGTTSTSSSDSMLAEVMKAQAAAQQQNFQMMIQMMQQNRGGENEQVRLLRDEMKEQTRRYDELLRRQEQNSQSLREELQRRELQQLQQKIDSMMSRPSDMDSFYQQYKKMQEMGMVNTAQKDKEVMLLQQQGDVTKQAVGMMDRELANLNNKTDMFLKPLAEVLPEAVRANIAKQSPAPNVPPSMSDFQLEQMMRNIQQEPGVVPPAPTTSQSGQGGFTIIGGKGAPKERKPETTS